MTNTNNLVWRLQNKLSLDDIEKMLQLKIIDEKEAKELAFNSAEDASEIKALKEQVKFLKELVDKLANKGSAPSWTYVSTYTPAVATWSPTRLLGTTYTTLASTSGSVVGKAN